jgi:hypothetical protein
MDWKSYPAEHPKESGKYLISVHRQLPAGIQVFNYSSHYDVDVDKWYKYDPFDDNYTPNEEINDKVAGWINDVGAYFGTL